MKQTEAQKHSNMPDDPALGYVFNESEDSGEYDTIPEVFY